MKKLSKRILCAVLILCAVSLTACKDKVKVDVHLTYDPERDALVEDNLGLDYRFASISYEPATITVPYADWEDVILYTVKGWDPKELLTEEFSSIPSRVGIPRNCLPRSFPVSAVCSMLPISRFRNFPI